MSFFGNTGKQPAKPKKVLNIDADQTNTNQEAIPVPYMAGRRRIALQFIAPVYNQVNKKITGQTGKGEEGTVGYVYYGDIMGLICMGGRAALSMIWKQIVDSEIAWKNDAGVALGTDAPVSISVQKYGATYIYSGTPDQGIDTNVATPIGPAPTTPGFDPRDYTTWPDGDQTLRHPPQ